MKNGFRRAQTHITTYNHVQTAGLLDASPANSRQRHKTDEQKRVNEFSLEQGGKNLGFLKKKFLGF